jgi:hypothetical protein
MVVSFNGKENGLPKENNVPSVDHEQTSKQTNKYRYDWVEH